MWIIDLKHDTGHTLRENAHRSREREGNLKLECGLCAYCRGANIVILNWPRPLWESHWEVVKRSDRDQPMRVSIHKYMEAMLGMSLYTCLYIKLAKTLCVSYYLLCFLFNKIREKEGKTGSAWKWRGEGLGGSNNVYTCK
jgi:hypothetical protein